MYVSVANCTCSTRLIWKVLRFPSVIFVIIKKQPIHRTKQTKTVFSIVVQTPPFVKKKTAKITILYSLEIHAPNMLHCVIYTYVKKCLLIFRIFITIIGCWAIRVTKKDVIFSIEGWTFYLTLIRNHIWNNLDDLDSQLLYFERNELNILDLQRRGFFLSLYQKILLVRAL